MRSTAQAFSSFSSSSLDRATTSGLEDLPASRLAAIFFPSSFDSLSALCASCGGVPLLAAGRRGVAVGADTPTRTWGGLKIKGCRASENTIQ